MVVEGIGVVVVGEDHVGVGQSRRPRLRAIDRGAGRVMLPMAPRAALRGHCGQLDWALEGVKRGADGRFGGQARPMANRQKKRVFDAGRDD